MRAGTGWSRTRRDSGYSVVEVLVTVALLGLVVVPILGAVSGAIRASAIDRDGAQLETALANAAEAVNRSPLSCDAAAYAAAVETVLADRSGSVHLHSLQVAHATGPSSWSAPDDACAGAAPTFDLVQRVTICLHSADDRLTRRVDVLKSHV